MNDMSSVIVPKSDQINADDLIAGSRTIRIADVKIAPGTEQPVSIVIEGEAKVFRPCKSMSRVLVAAWGADAKAYIGRSVTLYRDPTVKWGGMEVGGIRISHLTHIERDMVMALTATKGKRAPYTVKPLLAAVQPIAATYTIEQARADISEAADLAALKSVWTAKCMGPHRQALQGELDQRKADLAFDTIEQTETAGEAILSEEVVDRTAADEALTVIGNATTRAEVDERVGRFRKLLPDHADEIDAAGMARIEGLGE